MKLEGAKLWETVDSVVMLTWSDWKTEPRSNRYHFGTRFARHVPVFFVQPDSISGEVCFEQAAPNITIVHASTAYGIDEAERLASALYKAGCHRPMLWIYNVLFEPYIHRSNAILRVMHATEDYLTPPKGWAVSEARIHEPLIRTLEQVDLLVAVSKGVLESYTAQTRYTGAHLLLENGCDAKFWSDMRAFDYHLTDEDQPVALFQGGINKRLDFSLLIALARRLSKWQFWFCGDTGSRPDGWNELCKLPNVRYFGVQTVEGIAALARQASVGLIPFQQDALIRGSLPLKAYEYVACGMPVVTVPIDALAGKPQLFRFATEVEEFAVAMEQLYPTRADLAAIQVRLAEAAEQCYDKRFDVLLRTLTHHIEKAENRRSAGHRYNVILLYDDLHSMHVRTITEHIEAIQRYSGHNITLVPATGHIPGVDDAEGVIDFNVFDALVIHYSVRLSVEEHLSSGMAKAVAGYDGPKLLYIQDEYENTEIARRWIERLGIDAVFTCVPLDQVDKIYPRNRFAKVDFVETLTGYVPEDASLDDYAKPLADRRIVIGYRGRRLAHHYGRLGQEKIQIGVEVRERALKLGLPVDIEIDQSYRIHGNDWYRFLGSCRATLGTESGANVFDDDGELKRLAGEHSSMPFEEFAKRYLEAHEGKVRMNQVSPKIFEAIRLRTALVLFEGSYSGVVEPDTHYIPLKKDFSNFDDVVRKISSLDYLEALTDRAYRDIIESGRWSYRAFAEEFSRYLSRRLLGRIPRARIICAPVLAFRSGGLPPVVWPRTLMQALASGQILDRSVGRNEVLSTVGKPIAPLAVTHDKRGGYSNLRDWAMTTLRPWALMVPGLPWTVRALKRLLRALP
jgi:hypothetical protein